MWILLFILFVLVLLLLMRCSIIDSHMRQINSFIGNAVTTREMHAYVTLKTKNS